MYILKVKKKFQIYIKLKLIKKKINKGHVPWSDAELTRGHLRAFPPTA